MAAAEPRRDCVMVDMRSPFRREDVLRALFEKQSRGDGDALNAPGDSRMCLDEESLRPVGVEAVRAGVGLKPRSAAPRVDPAKPWCAVKVGVCADNLLETGQQRSRRDHGVPTAQAGLHQIKAAVEHLEVHGVHDAGC